MHLFCSGNSRSQIVKRNIILGFGVRGISILASLLLVPLTIGYINSELYGVWLTLTSVIHWISFFDIGFGNGLRNKLGETVSLNKYNLGKIYVSSTYFVMTVIFIPLGIICYLITPLVNWAEFINVELKYNDVLISTARIILLSFSIQMILKLIQNVSLAYQYSAFSSLIEMVGQIVSLIFIYFLTVTMSPDLKFVALALCLAPLIVYFMANLLCFKTIFRKVSPNLNYINLKAVKGLFNLGGEFFVIQVAALVLFQMINILISRFCGPEQVTNYNIAYKYLNTSLMFFNIIMAPTWSAFTDAYVKKDMDWMKRIYLKFIQLYIVSVFIIVICVIISPWIYKIWIGDKVEISIWLTIIVGIYMCVFLWCNFHSLIINGTGKIKFQLYTAVAMMIFFLPLALLLGDMFGLYGILWAMILINLPGVFYGAFQVNKLINFKAKGIFNE